jgi:hypothetical protein
MNRFIRVVPFVFEIQTLFLWLSRRTLISLTDYFIMRDIGLQLEILIARQVHPNARDPPKPVNSRLTSILLLIVCAAVVFGPLLALAEGSVTVVYNPPTAASLEFGYGSLPPLYQATGMVNPTTTSDQQEISDSGLTNWRFIVLNEVEMLSTITFPLFSLQNWRIDGSMGEFLKQLLGPSSTAEIIPYFRLNLHFEYSTSSAGATDYLWQNHLDPLNVADRAGLLGNFMAQTEEDVWDLPVMQLPVGLLVPSTSPIDELPDVNRSVELTPSNNTVELEWSLRLGSSAGTPLEKLKFLDRTDELIFLVWSEKVSPDSWLGTMFSSSGLLLVLYIVILLAVGLVVRDFTSGQGDSLWIDRMEYPERLYEQLLTTLAYGSTGDLEKEKRLADEFLGTLRSREKVLTMTGVVTE